jgi:hypothetical protein
MTTQELRELDAFLAEHGFGWKWYRYFGPMEGKIYFDGRSVLCDPNNPPCAEMWMLDDGKYPRSSSDGHFPHYSTDPAASDALLDRMAELGWLYSISLGGSGNVTAIFTHVSGKFGRGNDANRHLAIALAARAALESGNPFLNA